MKTSKQDRLNKAYEELIVRRAVKSKKEFAKELGYDYTGLIAAMSGNRPATNSMLSKIGYKWTFFNREWLTTGEGNITEQTLQNRGAEDTSKSFMDGYMLVAVKDLSSTTGRLWTEKDDDTTPHEQSNRLIPQEAEEGNYLIVKVKGHSMDDGTKRSICEGDKLLIKQYLDDVRSMPIRNKLFVVCSTEGNVVTQVADINSGTGDITCRSFNSLYPDYLIPLEKIMQTFTVEKKLESKIVF